jgi:uncharacterized protein YrrD
VNELFGEEVASQTNGEKQGTVQDIVFDEDGIATVWWTLFRYAMAAPSLMVSS